jgi:hypothetical protein
VVVEGRDGAGLGLEFVAVIEVEGALRSFC